MHAAAHSRNGGWAVQGDCLESGRSIRQVRLLDLKSTRLVSVFSGHGHSRFSKAESVPVSNGKKLHVKV
jgi:hypothetical protein